jgi:hypothetical protein
MAGVAFAGVLAMGGAAWAQAKMPDAQVEANVLKGLAGAPDLANQQITTTTVYGVVTLSGSVPTEALRTEAENIVARTTGVQKVVDELVLGAGGPAGQNPAGQGSAVADANPNPGPTSNGMVLQSDGTMVPAAQAQGDPNSNNPPAPPSANQAAGPNYGPGAPEYRQPYGGQQAGQQPAPTGQQYPGGYGPPPNYGQGQTGQGQAGGQQQPYPAQQQPYAGQQPYPAQQPPYPGQQRGYAQAPPVYGGQPGGETVMVPSGALVRIRINQSLDSKYAKAGDTFNGIVINDVTAGGAIAIPRGASVDGKVVSATKAGALSGRGELELQLTQVTMGGKTFPIVSDTWGHHGADKTTESVNRTVVGGAIGALIGAAAGGGKGAAIGAGAGGALGLGSSAASPDGQEYVPAEGLLTFHLAQDAAVTTVSQAEMDRLAQGVPGAGQQGLQRRYAPAYYPGYYRPYPYPYPY